MGDAIKTKLAGVQVGDRVEFRGRWLEREYDLWDFARGVVREVVAHHSYGMLAGVEFADGDNWEWLRGIPVDLLQSVEADA